MKDMTLHTSTSDNSLYLSSTSFQYHSSLNLSHIHQVSLYLHRLRQMNGQNRHARHLSHALSSFSFFSHTLRRCHFILTRSLLFHFLYFSLYLSFFQFTQYPFNFSQQLIAKQPLSRTSWFRCTSLYSKISINYQVVSLVSLRRNVGTISVQQR